MYESQESITIEYDNGMPNRMENGAVSLDTAAESSTRDTSADASAIDALAQTIEKTIDPMGYELVWLEVVNHRTGALRIFIDKAKPSESGITVEDCAAVSRALDEVLDTKVDTLGVFSGTYELEVSSPGINRPLWRAKDYLRFAGREARIHLIRPLLSAESRNEAYSQKNPKQKNFFGLLEGVEISGADPQASLICLKIIPEGSAKGVQRPQKKKKNSENSERSLESICIPMGLVQKAHLEPTFSAAVLLEEASDSNSFTRKES